MSNDGFREYFGRADDLARDYSDVEVISLYQQNPLVPVADLAGITGRSIAEFYRTLKRHSVQPSRNGTNQHLVLAYASQGYPVSEIAHLTGYTTRNVRYILTKHKLND